ncbi:hypothetical protein PENSPDRAFT_740245 [Peniophora sp. CONT]|nr:hypothetical protein PENSPDRAFT_740245 [Peniophora sp. CONT]
MLIKRADTKDDTSQANLENEAGEAPLGAERDEPRIGCAHRTLRSVADQAGHGVDGPVGTAEGAVAGRENERQPRSGKTRVSRGEGDENENETRQTRQSRQLRQMEQTRRAPNERQG